jgi:hypothetical protein
MAAAEGAKKCPAFLDRHGCRRYIYDEIFPFREKVHPLKETWRGPPRPWMAAAKGAKKCPAFLDRHGCRCYIYDEVLPFREKVRPLEKH